MSAMIRTIKRDISPEQGGVVLPHEHIFLNLMPEYRGNGLLNDIDLAVEEVGLYANAGGGTLVELSTGALARGSVGRSDDSNVADLEPHPNSMSRPRANVLALEEVSERTGIHIVAGTGHYREPYLDRAWFDRTSVDEIAAHMVTDIEYGISGTNLRAGIIGEIGSDKWYISAAEERSLRAAARAHHRTGAAISTHSARWAGLTHAQLRLLREEDVPPEKIIVGHVDTVPDPGYPLALAEYGVYVQFDTFLDCMQGGVVHEPSLRARVDAILTLVRAGHQDKVLVSQDVCLQSHLRRNGGVGYAFTTQVVGARLQQVGLSESDVQRIFEINPQRALSF